VLSPSCLVTKADTETSQMDSLSLSLSPSFCSTDGDRTVVMGSTKGRVYSLSPVGDTRTRGRITVLTKPVDLITKLGRMFVGGEK